MTNDEMKKLYKTEKWVCMVNNHNNPDNYGKWNKLRTPLFDDSCKYQLIHKKHEHILDAYLDGCEVYRFVKDGDIGGRVPSLEKSFIENYNSYAPYEVVPTSLEHCYCEATKLHIEKIGVNDGIYTWMILSDYDLIKGTLNESNIKGLKKIQYSEQLQKFTYAVPESITEPEDSFEADLTPIKPEPQYPIFKKSTTSGAIVKFTSKNKGTLVLGESGGNYLGETHSVWIDPMDTSSWTDIPYDSEKELYHGQPCYLDIMGEISIGIYDVNANSVVTKCFVYNYVNCTSVNPISLETIKTIPFIWDMYQELIKD